MENQENQKIFSETKDLLLNKSEKVFKTQIILTILSIMPLLITTLFSSRIFASSGNIPFVLFLSVFVSIFSIGIVIFLFIFLIKGLKIYFKLKINGIIVKKLLFSSVALLITAPLVYLIISILKN